MTPKRTKPRAGTRPGLTYRGIDRCDRCGAPLAPGDAITGLCTTHQRRERRASKRLTVAET